MASRDGVHCNDLSDRKKVGLAQSSYQLAVISHDVILHPCGGLELLPAVLTGERLLPQNRGELSHSRHSPASVCFERWTAAGAHQSAVLHVLLQSLHRLSAHTFTFGTGHSAFGHNLELPTFLLAPWRIAPKMRKE